MDYNPDLLKPFNKIKDADPRNLFYSTFDPETNDFRTVTLQDHHDNINEIVLHDKVPEPIIIQFDTAKNIYLYAWFAYRLYPVAEHHILACLEFALRDRFAKELPKKYWNNKKYEPTLRPLLNYAIDCGKLKNEHFSMWHAAAERRAMSRYRYELIEQMKEQGLTEMEIDESKIEILDGDRNWDYLNILKESLPNRRNMYAHGSSALRKEVLGTFTLVNEIICQIY